MAITKEQQEEIIIAWSQKAKEKIDISNVVGDYLFLQRNGNMLRSICPFHERKGQELTFEVNQTQQVFQCSSCQVEGDFFTFILLMNRKINPEFSAYDAFKLVNQQYIGTNIAHLVDPRHERHHQLIEMYEGNEFIANLYHRVLTETEEGKLALRYLLKRGLTMKTIKTFKIGFAPDSFQFATDALKAKNFNMGLMVECGLIYMNDKKKMFDRFRGRIIFPIQDIKNRVVGFGGRTIQDGVQPKYLNTSETPIFIKGEHVYNLNRVLRGHKEGQPIVYFEGYMDVIAAWQAGCTIGVATLGTAMTQSQVRLVSSVTDQAIICYDGDEPGQSATEKALLQNENFGMILKVAPMPAGTDPDDYVKAYGAYSFQRDVIGKAIHPFEFRCNRLRTKCFEAGGDRVAYQVYLQKIISLIKKLPYSEQHRYLTKFESRFHLSRRTFL
ncbi:DNA primase [Paenibacillus sp. FSL K6-3166]|uniref:DNA primase n=1 Tax=Paenibacillus sp. FSL K6-3166 TaxID=2921492 RepID=UPI0030F845F7